MIRTSLALLLIMSVSGCSWINRQADALGSHMPVIGERCEHWQCFTESGRQKSEMNKAQARAAAEGATQQEAAPVDAVQQQPAQAQQPMTPYDQYHQ